MTPLDTALVYCIVFVAGYWLGRRPYQRLLNANRHMTRRPGRWKIG